MELKEYLLDLSEKLDLATAGTDLVVFTDEQVLQWAAELRELAEKEE